MGNNVVILWKFTNQAVVNLFKLFIISVSTWSGVVGEENVP